MPTSARVCGGRRTAAGPSTRRAQWWVVLWRQAANSAAEAGGDRHTAEVGGDWRGHSGRLAWWQAGG